MSLASTDVPLAPLPDPVRQALRSRMREDLDVPLFPETAAKVMAACKDEATDASELTSLITHDPTLAVHVLRVANSAAYAPREAIVTLQQAITRLGLATICEICVAVSIKGRLFAVPGHQTRLRELWLHSAAAAAFAKEIAALRGWAPESYFLCGLLHDVGMPLTMQIFVDVAAKVGSTVLPRTLLESAMQEFHRPLGVLVIEKWSLGGWAAAAVRHHHDPRAATAHQREVEVTALADRLAYWALDDAKAPEDFAWEADGKLELSRDERERLLARRGRILAITEAFL